AEQEETVVAGREPGTLDLEPGMQLAVGRVAGSEAILEDDVHRPEIDFATGMEGTGPVLGMVRANVAEHAGPGLHALDELLRQGIQAFLWRLERLETLTGERDVAIRLFALDLR